MNNSDPFIHKIKKTLDEHPVDEKTLQKLNQSRYAALHQQPPDTFLSRFFRPALVIASVAVIAIAITLTIAPEQEPDSLDIFESMDIITSNDEFEMYENLEFYLWLDEQIKT